MKLTARIYVIYRKFHSVTIHAAYGEWGWHNNFSCDIPLFASANFIDYRPIFFYLIMHNDISHSDVKRVFHHIILYSDVRNVAAKRKMKMMIDIGYIKEWPYDSWDTAHHLYSWFKYCVCECGLSASDRCLELLDP